MTPETILKAPVRIQFNSVNIKCVLYVKGDPKTKTKQFLY